ncbi:MAG: hypothetical protein ACYDH2_05790 [Anaerolineaceae bacterium]
MKNIYQRNFINAFILLLGFLALTSCQLKNTPQESVVTNTPEIQTIPTTGIETQYPSTPEEVIRAFLIAYPSDPAYAVQYLSPSLVSKLDVASASKLLPASGEISGFIIVKGDTSAESEKSEILTNIAFQNTSSEIQFNLEIVDERWVIDQIIEK